MGKRKTHEPPPEFPSPLNMSENIEDMVALDAGCMSMEDGPLLGVFTVLTSVGHYDFFVDEETANKMIQSLRELMRGDSENLLDDDRCDTED